MLSILQWYRILSPLLSVHCDHVTYGTERNSAYLGYYADIPCSVVAAQACGPARLIVHLVLRPVSSLTDPSKTVYIISEQEDFYHPMNSPCSSCPRLASSASDYTMRPSTRASALGDWSVNDGECGLGVELRPEGEPLPPVGEEERELRGKGRKKGRKEERGIGCMDAA
ncbi:hypothetical protein C8T65DRAFT_831480 [Cerioporus squamosus]|nr:hypothetical protein C8T65DRAFT_831480 [Cerioporus squamosus]